MHCHEISHLFPYSSPPLNLRYISLYSIIRAVSSSASSLKRRWALKPLLMLWRVSVSELDCMIANLLCLWRIKVSKRMHEKETDKISWHSKKLSNRYLPLRQPLLLLLWPSETVCRWVRKLSLIFRRPTWNNSNNRHAQRTGLYIYICMYLSSGYLPIGMGDPRAPIGKMYVHNMLL